MYYYFYERSRETILRSRTGLGGKGLSTLESMLAGLIAGESLLISCWEQNLTKRLQALRRPSLAIQSG